MLGEMPKTFKDMGSVQYNYFGPAASGSRFHHHACERRSGGSASHGVVVPHTHTLRRTRRGMCGWRPPSVAQAAQNRRASPGGSRHGATAFRPHSARGGAEAAAGWPEEAAPFATRGEDEEMVGGKSTLRVVGWGCRHAAADAKISVTK